MKKCKKRFCNLGIYAITDIDDNDQIKEIEIRFNKKWLKFVPNTIKDDTNDTIKDKYYITAINNLIKINNFLHLQLENNTDEQYQQKLKTNIEKYLIQINELKNSSDINTINNILKSINKSLSKDEVSEMFSVKLK